MQDVGGFRMTVAEPSRDCVGLAPPGRGVRCAYMSICRGALILGPSWSCGTMGLIGTSTGLRVWAGAVIRRGGRYRTAFDRRYSAGVHARCARRCDRRRAGRVVLALGRNDAAAGARAHKGPRPAGGGRVQGHASGDGTVTDLAPVGVGRWRHKVQSARHPRRVMFSTSRINCHLP